jgi:hypothetical protein
VARVHRLDIGRLDAPEKTPQGFLKAPAHLTRAGVFTYYNADGSERKEYRSTAEVFRSDSLSTLIAAPVTHGHPPAMVDVANRGKYDLGNVGDNIVRDGGKVGATVYVKDGKLISAIERGDLREVSCGYNCDLDPTPGIVPDGEPDAGQHYDAQQKNISYNHVALVPQGRAGSEVRLRLDAAGNVIAPSLARKDSAMKVEVIDGVEYEIGGEPHKAAVKRRDEAQAKAKADADAAQAKLDAALADLEKARKDAADAPAKAKAAIEARVALETSAVKVLSGEKFDGKSDDEIRLAVVKAGYPDIKLDGKEPAYIAALFDAAVAKADAEPSLARELDNAREDSVIVSSATGDRAKHEQQRAVFAEALANKPVLLSKIAQLHGRRRTDSASQSRLVEAMIKASGEITASRVDSDGDLVTKELIAQARRDTGETGFLSRELLQKLRAPKDVKYAPRKGRQLAPVSNEVDPGAEAYSYDIFDRTGAAKLGSAYEGRAPRVDIKVSESLGKIEVVRAAFGWNVQDLRNAAFSGRSLPTMRGMACREAMEDGIDKNLANGSGALTGLVNNANIPILSTDTTGGAIDLSGFAGDWDNPSTTVAAILGEITSILSNRRSATQEIEFQEGTVDVVLPTAQYDALATRLYSDAHPETILSLILRTNPFIRSITSWNKLAGAGVSSRDRALFYTRSPMLLEAQIPLEPMTHPVEAEALEFLVEMEARVAGVSFYYPLSAVYVDGV